MNRSRVKIGPAPHENKFDTHAPPIVVESAPEILMIPKPTKNNSAPQRYMAWHKILDICLQETVVTRYVPMFSLLASLASLFIIKVWLPSDTLTWFSRLWLRWTQVSHLAGARDSAKAQPPRSIRGTHVCGGGGGQRGQGTSQNNFL